MSILNDTKRNFLVLIIACVLNFCFALEKFLIIISFPLSDVFWFLIYGGFSLILAIFAFYDYYHDVKESKMTTPNII